MLTTSLILFLDICIHSCNIISLLYLSICFVYDLVVDKVVSVLPLIQWYALVTSCTSQTKYHVFIYLHVQIILSMEYVPNKYSSIKLFSPSW